MPGPKKKQSKKKEPTPIDPIRVEVGARLRAARDAVTPKLTQQDVADHFRINKNTVSAWEKGRGAPDIYVLRELTKLYGRSGDAMLWGSAPAEEVADLLTAYNAADEGDRKVIRRAARIPDAIDIGMAKQQPDSGKWPKPKESKAKP